jgi:hypothetical protein
MSFGRKPDQAPSMDAGAVVSTAPMTQLSLACLHLTVACIEGREYEVGRDYQTIMALLQDYPVDDDEEPLNYADFNLNPEALVQIL